MSVRLVAALCAEQRWNKHIIISKILCDLLFNSDKDNFNCCLQFCVFTKYHFSYTEIKAVTVLAWAVSQHDIIT